MATQRKAAKAAESHASEAARKPVGMAVRVLEAAGRSFVRPSDAGHLGGPSGRRVRLEGRAKTVDMAKLRERLIAEAHRALGATPDKGGDLAIEGYKVKRSIVSGFTVDVYLYGAPQARQHSQLRDLIDARARRHALDDRQLVDRP